MNDVATCGDWPDLESRRLPGMTIKTEVRSPVADLSPTTEEGPCPCEASR